MSLKDIPDLEIEYDTKEHDVLNEFYIPALAQTRCYKRMAGYFSSTALAVAAKGVESLILNGGKMRLLTSPNFSKEDLEIIEKYGTLEFGEIVVDALNNAIDSDFIENEYTEALGWMLANGTLEMRIVVVMKDSKICRDNIFHNKIGIMSDGTNTLAFSGSINETSNGWIGNIENFDVYCDWDDKREAARVHRKIEYFERYWELGETESSKTVEIPEAVKNNWICNVPEDRSELKIIKKRQKSIKLRDYQKTAIQSWMDNDCRGIFNMATGTGKTITAIYALKQLLDSEPGKKHTIVVAVPFQHLIKDPWISTLKSEIFINEKDAEFIEAFGDSKIWRPVADGAISDQSLGVIRNVVFVTTYDTMSSESFTKKIEKSKGRKILIADEVHNSGSDTYRLGLLDVYDCRLGLSATPARYLDEEGTEYISEYFGCEIYEFSLERAINEINPDTGETYLTPYYYRPIFVSLNKQEIADYKELSSKMAKFAAIEDLTPNQRKQYLMIQINRSRIVKNAKSKVDRLQEIIPTLKEEGFLKHCLIYCSDGKDPDDNDRTISKVISILNENKVKSRRFTSEEKVDERHKILREFADADISTLVAIKCLDEGVDVPSTRNAIIMASTGNPREYIQRRGRILRRSPGKKHAIILDFVVGPNDCTIDAGVEKQVLANELRRFYEFSIHSINKEENLALFNTLAEKYNLEVNLDV